MSIKYKTAVQKLRAQYVEADFADLPSGVFVPLIELPSGSVLVEGTAYSLTASDAATSEKIDVGTSGTPTGNGGISNSKTAGVTALTLNKAPTERKTLIGITRTAVGAVTEGTYGLFVAYAIAGGSDATQG